MRRVCRVFCAACIQYEWQSVNLVHNGAWLHNGACSGRGACLNLLAYWTLVYWTGPD